jgi:hypothetical protein
VLGRKSGRFAIALDATGSMGGLIDDARRSIKEIIRRVVEEAGCPIEIELFAYRDYDVGKLILERSDATSDADRLARWLEQIRPLGGGGNDGEAIEAALDAIVRDGNFSAVLVAGDEPSNSRRSIDGAGRRNALSARELAGQLRMSNVPVHTFVVGGDPRTVTDFADLAQISGGRSGRLDGSKAMIDMAVMAMIAALKGAGGVRDYMQRTELTSSAKEFGQLLLGQPK